MKYSQAMPMPKIIILSSPFHRFVLYTTIDIYIIICLRIGIGSGIYGRACMCVCVCVRLCIYSRVFIAYF